jgi:electron transfer flavoprotein beta subunit
MRGNVIMERELFVCVKQATDVERPVRFTADAKSIAAHCRRWVRNKADHFALEEALRARERGEVNTVSCVSVGPAPAIEALAYCLASGADRAVWIPVPDELLFDSWAVGALLGSAIRHLGGRLVFTAQRSSDGESGLVPGYAAHTLGAAFISNVADVCFTRRGVEIRRKIERGHRQVWRASLPAVLAFAEGINTPRYVSVAAVIVARRRTIEEIRPEKFGVTLSAGPRLTQLERLMPARIRPKKLLSPVSSQSAAERMMAVSAGGLTDKSRKVLEGSREDLAAEAVAHLKDKRLLRRPGSREA